MTAEPAAPEPSPTGGAPWSCRVVSTSPLVVVVGGELDTLTGPLVAECLAEALDGSEGPARIEIGEVTFIDSQGLSALIEVRNRYSDRAFTLVSPRPNVRRLMDITGLDQIFTITE